VPRQIRIEYLGAIYHLLNRGDCREAKFTDDGDCHDFLKTLAEACQKTGFEVHAFCLKKNHFHLVVETPEGNLMAGIIAQQLRRLGWNERDLSQRPKTDADKLCMAARLRAETTMTIGQIAQRLKMGTRHTLGAKLQQRKGTNE